MAKARALDKRRKSIRNIRKITRTMELIATARFKKAMDRAHAATAYTRRITQLVADLAKSGLEVKHPLLEGREKTERAVLLVLTANRGLCGGYNGNVLRAGFARYAELQDSGAARRAGDLRQARHRGGQVPQHAGRPNRTRTSKTSPASSRSRCWPIGYLEDYAAGKLDRLDVVYMRFESVSRQYVAVETLLPLGALDGVAGDGRPRRPHRSTNFSPRPKAFWKKSCRRASRSSSSSASSTRPSASRSPAWSP